MNSSTLPAVEEERSERLDRFLESTEDQNRYRAWLEYARQIPKDDEILRLLDIFGLLTKLTRETPEKIVEERENFAALLAGSLTQLAQLQDTTAAYREELEKRLKQLPPELREAIDPEKIAQQLALCLKQEFAGTGIEETRQRLALAASQLQPVAKSFERTTAALTDPYTGLAGRADAECRRLIESASQMRAASDQLARDSRHLHIWWMLFAALILFSIGWAFGVQWEKESTTSYLVGIQYELQQVEAKLKASPPATPAPPTAHSKRKQDLPPSPHKADAY